MKSLQVIEKVISLIQKGSSSLFSTQGMLVTLKFAVPLVLTTGTIGGLYVLDRKLIDNPELHRSHEENIRAYMASLEENLRNNPWGATGARAMEMSESSARAYIMSLFLGKSPEFRERLRKILERVPGKKLNFLVALFQSVELNDKLVNRFVALVEKIMEKSGAGGKLQLMIDIAQKTIEKKVQKSKAQDGDSESLTETEGQTLTEPTEEELQAMLDEELSQAELDSVVEAILAVEDAEVFDNLLDIIAQLSPEMGEKVKELISAMASADADKLTTILRQLDRDTIELIVNNLARLSKGTISSLTNRFEKATKPQIITANEVMQELAPPTVDEFVDLTQRLSDRQFFFGIDLLAELSSSQIAKLFKIGKKVGDRKFGQVIDIVDVVGPPSRNNALDLLNGVNSSSVNNYLQLAAKLSNQEIKKSVDLLSELKSDTLQKKAITIFDNIQINNAKKGIALFDKINLGHFKKAVNHVYELDRNIQDAIIDRFARIKTHDAPDFKPPTGNSKAIYGTTVRRTKTRRVELLIDKLVEVGSHKVSTDLVKVIRKYDDTTLNKAADVFIDLDIQSDKNRAKRLLRTANRMKISKQKTVMDSLEDMSKDHVNAAIDLVDKSDDKFLNDSVDFQDHLKKRLGRKEGIDTTMRALNVATQFKDDKERQDGLTLIKSKKAKTMRKVLKQVELHPDTFTQPILGKMVKLHERVGDFHGKRFTKIISGDEGFTIGGRLGGGGATRFVTNERKYQRLRMHFTENTEPDYRKEKRLDFFKSRAFNVSTNNEPESAIVEPTRVTDVRAKSSKARKEFKLKKVDPDDS